MTIKTLSCPIPSNINPLSPNGFMFSINKLPELSYFCQVVNLPGLTLGSPDMATPFVNQPIPGEMLSFETLNVQFLIDEEMENYKAIHNWLIALGFPEDYQQYIDGLAVNKTQSLSELAKNYSDGSLTILGSNNRQVQTVAFADIFPISIETITFQSTNTDVMYLVGSATFKYAYYKFV